MRLWPKQDTDSSHFRLSFAWQPALPVEAVIEIRAEQNLSGGRYVAVVDGHEAEMTYSRTSPKLIIIDHTGVPDALRGKGVGQALAEYAVAAAREGGWRIIPLCPFFKAQSQRHKEWQDVVQ